MFTGQCRPLLLEIVPRVRMHAVERDEYGVVADKRVIGIAYFRTKYAWRCNEHRQHQEQLNDFEQTFSRHCSKNTHQNVKSPGVHSKRHRISLNDSSRSEKSQTCTGRICVEREEPNEAFFPQLSLGRTRPCHQRKKHIHKNRQCKRPARPDIKVRNFALCDVNVVARRYDSSGIVDSGIPLRRVPRVVPPRVRRRCDTNSQSTYGSTHCSIRIYDLMRKSSWRHVISTHAIGVSRVLPDL